MLVEIQQNSVRDRIGQISIYSKKISYDNGKIINTHCKNFNSLVLSCHMKLSQKVSKSRFSLVRSDLDTSWGYIVWGLSCWKCYNGTQWVFMIFLMSKIGYFFGINTDLRIDLYPNSISDPENEFLSRKGMKQLLLKQRKEKKQWMLKVLPYWK